MSLSKNGKSMVTVQTQETASLWVSETNGIGEPRQVSASNGNLDGVRGVDWTPDGKIVYQSAAVVSMKSGSWIPMAQTHGN